MSRLKEIKTFTKCDVELWNSIKQYKKDYLICGVKDLKRGAVFVGDIEGCGKLHEICYPGAEDFSTQITFGEYSGKGTVSLVGKLVDVKKPGLIGGFRYHGKLTEEDLNDHRNYKQFGLDEKITVPLSQSKNIIVGISGDSSKCDESGFVSGPLSAFIYDIQKGEKRYITNPAFKSMTATGIVDIDDHKFIICGSASEKPLPTNPDNVGIIGSIIGRPYLVEYNSKTHSFSNWKFFGHKDHHDIFSRECQYSGFSSISKSCDDEFQVIANVVGGSTDRRPNVYEVTSFWGRLHRNDCGDFHDEKFIVVSTDHKDDFDECERLRRQYVATGVYHDKFVGLRVKETRECKDVGDKYAGFQAKFHVEKPCCECTCTRIFKPNYITECWMTGPNRNPYSTNCLYRECDRFTECGIIPIVPPGTIPVTGPVVCPNPTNPSIVPVVGDNVPLHENLVNDENAWGPHDIRWTYDGPWRHCECGWRRDDNEETGCSSLTYPGGFYWHNCGGQCCWNDTACRDPTEWFFDRCPIHGCPEFKDYSGFAIYGAFPRGNGCPGVTDVANDINIGIKLKYNNCGPLGVAPCGPTFPKYFTPPIPATIANSPCNPLNPLSPLNPCNL